MKPRIFKEASKWYCYSYSSAVDRQMYSGMGDTPQMAYDSWARAV